ncbi:DNA repair protein RadC [Pseudomonas aeruginosa]|nr:DNA repair protein RadC [Pseudomonas aeruginosa]
MWWRMPALLPLVLHRPPEGLSLPGQASSDFIPWRFAMSYVVADSRPESLSLIAAQHEDWIIRQAITLLEQRIFKAGPVLNSPAAVRDYLHLKLVAEPNEVFAVVFLNCQHQVLAYEPMFKGTVDQTSVYPRVLVQRALALNASAVILAHQHPSGMTVPSAADQALTDRLKAALAMVDVRVVDHFIVGKGTPYSFAESGLL